MEFRQQLPVLVLAAVVLLAGCAGGFAADDGTADDGTAEETGADDVTVQIEEPNGDGATVAVAGEGSVEAQPDRATLHLRVTDTGEDPETVRDGLSRNASAVREALLEYGLDEEQIRSEGFRIRENRRAHREPDSDRDPYLGYHRLVVTLENPDSVGEVIDVAVESAPVRVDSVRFGLSDERREELRDEALSEAMDDARSEAELLVQEEGHAIESVDRITTREVSAEPVRGTVVHEAAATPTPGGSANTRVEAGDVTVTATVNVVYNASETS